VWPRGLVNRYTPGSVWLIFPASLVPVDVVVPAEGGELVGFGDVGFGPGLVVIEITL